jgi:OmpA-OmpF porin, OOP family
MRQPAVGSLARLTASLTAAITASLTAAITFTATPSRADDTGFALDSFEPSERGSEWFWSESLDLRGHLRRAAGVVGDVAYRPLVLTDANGAVVRSIVRDQDFLHVGGSIVLWDRVRVGMSLPLLFNADGFAVSAGGRTYPSSASSAGVGDVRVGADVRLVGTYGGPFTAALGAQIFLPVGEPASFTSDGQVRAAPRVLIAGDVGPFAYAGRVGATVRPLNETYAGGHVGSDLLLGGAVGVRLADRRLLVGPELFARSALAGNTFGARETPVEGLLGAHCTLGDVRIGGGFGAGLSSGFGSPAARGLFSLEWAPGVAPSDADRDGIAVPSDACPDVRVVASADAKANGCPSDRDRDGIVDAGDACPGVPGAPSADPKRSGCPAPSDADNDAIADADDACPNAPGPPSTDPRNNGCPVPADSDNDGIVNAYDACPLVPGVRSTDPRKSGCPEDVDRDKDGVPNYEDVCPDEPGRRSSDPRTNGCPAAVVKGDHIEIAEQVQFATASAQLLPASDAVLSAVLKVLTQHPDIALTIEGHTDNAGKAAENKRLSAARAESVVKWLVQHGVPAARLRSAGFGQERPIDTNETPAGRQRNRRVEFHIDKGR